MSGAGVAAAVAGAAVSGGIGAASSGKGGKKAPTPPDPYVTAQQQTQLNRQASNYDANMNRFQQYGPSGQVTWQNYGDDDNPSWVQRTELKPENQRLYDQQLGNKNVLAAQAGEYAKSLPGRLNTTARQINNDTFNQVADTQLSRMQPGLDHRTKMLTTDLVNQGLAPGGEAYQMGMLTDSQGRNDAYLAAVNSAMNAQVQENSMINQNEQQNNANQTQALANVGSLLGYGGEAEIPTYSGSTAVNSPGAVDIASLINQQYGQNNANTIASNNVQQAKKNQIAGAGGSLGSAVTQGINGLPKTSSGKFIMPW